MLVSVKGVLPGIARWFDVPATEIQERGGRKNMGLGPRRIRQRDSSRLADLLIVK